MIVDTAEIKMLNAEKRRSAARASAEKFKAQSTADAVNGWNTFLQNHTGAKAVRDGVVFFDCVANRNALELFLAVEGELPVNAETLEFAYRECRPQLAKTPTTGEYQRKTDASRSRIAPQQRSFLPATKRAPYTAQEIRSFGPSQMRAALRVYGAAELNRILAGQN